MHIPDGFLDPKVSGGLALASAAVASFCLSKVKQTITAVVPSGALAAMGRGLKNVRTGSKRVMTKFGRNLILKTVMVSSLVFFAQMFDFIVVNGTSGHYFGGILAGVLLGPYAGSLAMASVVVTQALFLGDGGIYALGANLLNMMVLGTFVSYYIYAFLKKRFGLNMGVALASFLSLAIASFACSLELWISGKYAFYAVMHSMFYSHLVIGIAEALITLGIINLLYLSPAFSSSDVDFDGNGKS